MRHLRSNLRQVLLNMLILVTPLLFTKILLCISASYLLYFVPSIPSVIVRKKQLPPQKEGEIDPKLLELLLSAPKKDYERICYDFGVTDFRWLLKRLNQLKKEREDEQAKVLN